MAKTDAKLGTTAARTPARRRSARSERTAAVEVGSGNVFRDLGRADADERRLKVQLAMRVNALLADLKLTQSQAARRLGIAQPHVSDLVHYRLNRFSVERLIHLVTLLDRDVEIVIRPRVRSQATVAVLVAT